MLKKMSIYYTNIRDLKSKETSFKARIEETQPSIIAVTETWLNEEDSLKIEGYETIYRNEREGKGGGILIAIHNNLRHVVCETGRTNEEYESIWIVLNNGKVNLKLGVVYFPQEKDITVMEAESIYRKIRTEISDGRNKGQQVMVLGDFNCKVGNKIQGNHKEKTSGGKMLLNLVREGKLVMVNATEMCKGLWTRVEKNQRSVLDYVLVTKENLEIIKEMIIDEEKEFAPLRIKEQKGELTKVYSDHNVIILRLNLIEPEKQKAERLKRMVITAKGYAQIRNDFKREDISKIWEESTTLEERYTKWSKKVKEIEERYKTQPKRRKFTSKKVRVMKKLHKQLKKKRKEVDEEEKSVHFLIENNNCGPPARN